MLIITEEIIDKMTKDLLHEMKIERPRFWNIKKDMVFIQETRKILVKVLKNQFDVCFPEGQGENYD